jgi:peptidoglycan/LPS O-acetylase OafA/YrhL
MGKAGPRPESPLDMLYWEDDRTRMTATDSPGMLQSGLTRKHLPTLDGLRAVAVFLVILNHAGLPAPGGLGVLMFFVLSGFLITWLLLREDAASGTVSISDFYFRRVLRIFPAFYVYAAVILVLALSLARQIVWPQVIASLFYVNNYYQAIHGDPASGFSQTWSLGVEEQFYLTWPALFILLRRDGPKFRRVVAALIVGAWAYRAILQFGFHVHQGWFYEAFDTRFDHLLVGCLLALVLFKGPSERWERYCSSGALLAGACAMLAFSVWLESLYGAAYRDSIAFIVDPLLVAAMIPMLIAQRGRAALRWLEAGPVKYVGRVSYSAYLYQQLVTEPVMKLFRGFPLILRVALTFGAVIVVAGCSYYVIERPFLRLKDRKFRTKVPVSAPGRRERDPGKKLYAGGEC